MRRREITVRNETVSTSGKLLDHAVVIGGGIAGLLAARVLTDHFAQVTVLERDRLPEGPQPRKGIPQARHPHGMKIRGWHILDRL